MRAYKFSKMTQAIIIDGNAYVFRYSKKPLNCDVDCALSRFCSSNNQIFSRFCKLLKTCRCGTFDFGVFKTVREDDGK